MIVRRSAQILALTDVEAPRGTRYRVQIRPPPPVQRQPLPMIGGVADLLLPASFQAPSVRPHAS